MTSCSHLYRSRRPLRVIIAPPVMISTSMKTEGRRGPVQTHQQIIQLRPRCHGHAGNGAQSSRQGMERVIEREGGREGWREGKGGGGVECAPVFLHELLFKKGGEEIDASAGHGLWDCGAE